MMILNTYNRVNKLSLRDVGSLEFFPASRGSSVARLGGSLGRVHQAEGRANV